MGMAARVRQLLVLCRSSEAPLERFSSVIASASRDSSAVSSLTFYLPQLTLNVLLPA